eukprot:TRINITY_DN799_c0_g1_i1.p2 TRINITY_DN799_c0_g1~~TRINITY_DN799_c0_g1_i1.p2  ORF type:complete len:251 (-),score=121.38 TRINITY_DN799_c0_g1_i1:710-1462(-)
MDSNPFALLSGDAPAKAPAAAAVEAKKDGRASDKAKAQNRRDGNNRAGRGGRGGRGGGNNRRGREFDRHSGTGRGKEGKKNDAGRHNWGDKIASQQNIEGVANGDLPGDNADGGDDAEDDSKNITLAEYKKQQEAARPKVALPEARKAEHDKKYDSMVALEKKPLDENNNTGNNKKGKKKKNQGKQVVNDLLNLRIADERDDRRGGDRDDRRGGGRGGNSGRGGGRGGKGGSSRGGNFNIADANAFPSLG